MQHSYSLTAPLQIIYVSLLILHYTLVSSDPLLKCQHNLCKNGGTCYLTSEVIHDFACNAGETYFNDNCYQLHLITETWDVAQERCKTTGGYLISIENNDELAFVQYFLLEQTKNLTAPFRDIGVWIAGHSVLNYTEPVYVWKPGNYLITDFHWQHNEPNIYVDYTNVCIFLDYQNRYNQWRTGLCTTEKYFVCQRNITGTDNKQMIAQCYCPDGYFGEHCEFYDETGENVHGHQYTCGHDRFHLKCRNAQKIHIDFAMFGNYGESENICKNSKRNGQNIIKNLTCIHSDTLQRLIALCEGLHQCSLAIPSDFFGKQPCYGSPEYLDYRYRCLSDGNATCQSDMIHIDGRCYQLNLDTSSLATWTEASQDCMQKGGLLASTISNNVHNQLTAAAKNNSLVLNDFWISISTTSESDIVVGENTKLDFQTENVTIAGTGCVYYKYNTDTSNGAFWNSDDCSSKKQWICELGPELLKRSTENYQKMEPKKTVFIGTAPLHISTVDNNRTFCPETNLYGVTFQQTPSCSEAIAPCPDNSNGFIVLQCQCDEAIWQTEPNTRNCTHQWSDDLQRAIDRGDSAEYITQQWSIKLRQTIENIMYVADLVNSINIGQQLLQLAREQFDAMRNDREERSKRAYNFTKHFGESGDLLLNNRTKDIWLMLDGGDRLSNASTLMSLLEQTAALMGAYQLEDRQQIGFQNWAMEVRVKQRNTANDDYGTEDSISTRIKSKLHVPTRARPASADYDLADISEQDRFVSFENFSLSPTIQMPKLDVLDTSIKEGIAPEMPQEDMPRFRIASSPAVTSSESSSLRLGYFLFNSLGPLLNPGKNTIVNSLIIGASVNDPSSSIQLPDDSPVSFVFYHVKTVGVANPRCVYWNVTLREWNQNGCKILNTTNISTSCSCNHLTSFAVLMDVTGNPVLTANIVNDKALSIITIIGCSLSVVCLFFSFLTFTCFRSLWNIRNTIHRNLCLCLLIAELVFVIGVDRTSIKNLCSAIAVVLHYIFLCAFCWMLLEGYQLYLMLVHVFEPGNVRIFLYYLWCYGLPAVIVGVSAGVSWHNYGTSDYCWLNVNTPIIWTFAGPVLAIVIGNITFLGIAFKVVLSVKTRDRNRAERIFGWLKGSATLLCLLGVTWIFGFLMAVNKASVVFAYIFTIFNCTQGIFIFVLHVLMNEKVRVNIIRFLRNGLCCISDRKSGYASKSYISSRQKFLDLFKHSSDANNSGQQRSTNSTGITPPNPLIEAPPLGEYATNPSIKASVYEKWCLKSRNDVAKSDPEYDISDDDENLRNNSSENSISRFTYYNDKSKEQGRTAPVRRKKFPLGAGEQDRRSPLATDSVIIERF